MAEDIKTRAGYVTLQVLGRVSTEHSRDKSGPQALFFTGSGQRAETELNLIPTEKYLGNLNLKKNPVRPS